MQLKNERAALVARHNAMAARAAATQPAHDSGRRPPPQGPSGVTWGDKVEDRKGVGEAVNADALAEIRAMNRRLRELEEWRRQEGAASSKGKGGEERGASPKGGERVSTETSVVVAGKRETKEGSAGSTDEKEQEASKTPGPSSSGQG